MTFSLSAPAKINWLLAVLGKRPDGYHDIVSPMQCISLCDTLTFEESDTLQVISELDIPEAQNLVYRAAALFRSTLSEQRGARITLKKEIPTAAGLGGGSSDAAAAFLGLQRLWDIRVSGEDLLRMAAEIGSDVPFFLKGRFSLIEGRGERVTPLGPGPSISLVLVKPDFPVSAASAYAGLPAKLTKKSIDIKLFCQTLERKDFSSLRQLVFNDLESAVIGKHAVIAELKRMLLDAGAVLASMSGSGPTVFGVFRSSEEASKASEAMDGIWSRAVETLC